MKRFSVQSIALSNLKRRRRSYVMLAVSIGLAIYFVAVMLLVVSMLFTSVRELHNDRYGEQDAIIHDCKDAPLEELIRDGVFREYGCASVIAYAVGAENGAKAGFSIASFDDAGLRLSRKRVEEGRFPEKAGEIALEKSMLARLRTGAGIGDTLTLRLMVPAGSGVPDGSDVPAGSGVPDNADVPDSAGTPDNSGLFNETGYACFLDGTIVKTYMLTGILADQYIFTEKGMWDMAQPVYNDYPAAVVSSEEKVEAGGRAVVKCYGIYAGEAEESFEKAKAFCGRYDPGLRFVTESTRYQGITKAYLEGVSPHMLASPVFFAVIALILVLAACLGIVNAFSANLQDRNRQIGLLRAVGATRRQIRAIFGREALILSLISVPPALLSACLTVWGIKGILGANYRFIPDAFTLAGVAVFGMTGVMLAALIPLRRASRIAPMQAIRDMSRTPDRKQQTVRSEDSFDVPRLLAKRNLKLYKSSRVSFSILLAFSIVLISIISSALFPFAKQAWQKRNPVDFALVDKKTWQSNWLIEEEFPAPGMSEQDREDILSLSGVERVDGEKIIQLKILMDRVTPYITGGGNGLTASYAWYLLQDSATDSDSDIFTGQGRFGGWQEEKTLYRESKEKYGYASDYLTVTCGVMDEQTVISLSGFVSEGRINPEKLASGEEILIIAPAEYGLSREGEGGFRVDYTLRPDQVYLCTARNDSFHAGGIITLSQLYTAGKLAFSETGEVILPDDAVRKDKTVVIGAVLDPALAHTEGRYFPTTGSFRYQSFNLVTTHAGLASLGFDVPSYSSLWVHLKSAPDSDQEAYLTEQLEQIGYRTATVDLHSYVAAAREKRELSMAALIVSLTLMTLFFSICASLVTRSVTARIHAGRREIGTLRAVGATQGDIVRSYLWQLVSLFSWGSVTGIAATIAICVWLIHSEQPGLRTFVFPSWQPLAFITILFLLSYAGIRRQIKKTAKGSIVENIREL